MSQTIATLELFAEKAGRLGELLLAQDILKSYRASIRWTRGEPWTGEYSGPEGEAVEAYILTLRMLIQDNEPISLRRMRRLYRDAPISVTLADQFDEACAELNAFLDSETNLAIEEGRRLTCRDIFEVFVYGFRPTRTVPRSVKCSLLFATAPGFRCFRHTSLIACARSRSR